MEDLIMSNLTSSIFPVLRGKNGDLIQANSLSELKEKIQEVFETNGLMAELAIMIQSINKELLDLNWLFSIKLEPPLFLGSYHSSSPALIYILRTWYDNYGKLTNPVPVKEYIGYYDQIDNLNITNVEEYLLAKEVTNSFERSLSLKLKEIPNWKTIQRSVLIKQITGLDYSVWKRMKHRGHDARELVINLLPEINMDYWEGGVNIGDLIAAGVSLETFTLIIPEMEYFSKAEKYAFLKAYSNKELYEVRTYHCWIWYTHKAIDKPNSIKAKAIDGWIRDHYISSFTMLKWVIRNVHHLMKVREVKRGNRTEAFYYSSYLRHLKEEHLIHGEKTAWRKVVSQVKDKIKRDIYLLLEKDMPLPVLEPIPEFPNVRQLVSSAELKEEGIRMDHCVGDYIEYCLDEESYIFHVDIENELGATAEVIDNGELYELNKTMGYDNSVADEAEAIMVRYVEELNKRRDNGVLQ